MTTIPDIIGRDINILYMSIVIVPESIAIYGTSLDPGTEIALGRSDSAYVAGGCYRIR
jgi:hypothetical protein